MSVRSVFAALLVLGPPGTRRGPVLWLLPTYLVSLIHLVLLVLRILLFLTRFLIGPANLALNRQLVQRGQRPAQSARKLCLRYVLARSCSCRRPVTPSERRAGVRGRPGPDQCAEEHPGRSFWPQCRRKRESAILMSVLSKFYVLYVSWRRAGVDGIRGLIIP